MNRLKKAREFRRKINANLNATRKLIRVDELDEEELLEMIDLYESYQVGKQYKEGDILKYDGKLYEVIQAHTTQADWQPNVAASLWRVYTPNETLQGTEIIPDFVQPVSTNPYNTGDKVIFEGKVYESAIDNNIWSPVEHPSSWKSV